MVKRSFLVILLLVGACSQTNQLPAEAWGVADYAAAGLTIDKPWAPSDYTTAAKVLGTATAGHRDRLPRFGGPKSGAVFAKLLVDLPDDAAAPIGQRFGSHFERTEALNVISRLYMPNAFDTPPREWIELMGALLRESVVLTRDADAFIASFGPDDPSRAHRLDGLAKMKTGYGSMMLGGILVADQLRVPQADRVAMLAHVTTALPSLFPIAPTETQLQIRDKLAKQVAGFPAGTLRDSAVAAQNALPQ